jgi:hypothetical protein
METLGNKKLQKSCNIYNCTFCDYTTSRKSSYEKHLFTSKHINVANGNVLETFGNQKLQKSCNFACDICSKEFQNRSGLWKHKKKCFKECKNEHEIIINKELILMILKQNQDILKENNELKNIIVDTQNNMLKVIENGTSNTSITNITNTNSNNKSFNLQFFLNETCKNAMNITDFVNSLQLQLSDLENVGEVGYIEGISNIIIKKLNALDITLRPVHCTDKKRETMYIKDENKWEKEDDNKSKLHKLVRKVSNKNIDLISEFKEIHPDWKKSTSKVSDQFNKIIIESMGGAGDNDYEKEEKIIKKVAKCVFIDKESI